MTRPLFVADWRNVHFLHFEMEPDVLQAWVPYPLDLHEGRAYVSLVRFSMENLRSQFLPRAVLKPMSDHTFLNARTYVKAKRETGIFFLAEWLSKRFPVPFGRGRCLGCLITLRSSMRR